LAPSFFPQDPPTTWQERHPFFYNSRGGICLFCPLCPSRGADSESTNPMPPLCPARCRFAVVWPPPPVDVTGWPGLPFSKSTVLWREARHRPPPFGTPFSLFGPPRTFAQAGPLPLLSRVLFWNQGGTHRFHCVAPAVNPPVGPTPLRLAKLYGRDIYPWACSLAKTDLFVARRLPTRGTFPFPRS